MSYSIQVRFWKNRESRIAWPMNEVYGLVYVDKLRFVNLPIGIPKGADSEPFPFNR
jgi:hypothetical protein